MSYSRFLEMELWRFKVHVQRGILCSVHFFFSFFDLLYLMTDVPSGDGKGVIFLNFDSSFMCCEQFCPGRTFYFDDFYVIEKPWAKIQKPSGTTSVLPIFVSIISKCNLYRSRYQHTKFRTCMNICIIFAIWRSTISIY